MIKKLFGQNLGHHTLKYSESNFFDRGNLFYASQRLKLLYRIGPWSLSLFIYWRFWYLSVLLSCKLFNCRHFIQRDKEKQGTQMPVNLTYILGIIDKWFSIVFYCRICHFLPCICTPLKHSATSLSLSLLPLMMGPH